MFGAETAIVYIVLVAFLALLVLTASHFLHQPPILGYILTGIMIGPTAMGLAPDFEVLGVLGELGLVLLLFFIGMEIDVHLLIRQWRAVAFGTTLQIIMGVFAMAFVGMLFGWDISRVVLLGFIISLSSTAVVLRYLEASNMLGTRVGNYVCGILFAQDIAVAPMVVVLTLMAQAFSPLVFFQQVFGMAGIAFLFYYLWKHKPVAPPVLQRFLKDHEHALFFNITLGLGIAALTGILGLSVGVGAFLAGILVARHYSRERLWRQLESVKTILVATFFMSIGALIDISFVFDNLFVIVLVVLLVLGLNTVAYAGIFHFLNIPTHHSFYMAALLAQIGEFSFFLALVGRQLGLIVDYTYQMTIVVIAVSLLISPLWIQLFKRFEPNCANKRVCRVAVS